MQRLILLALLVVGGSWAVADETPPVRDIGSRRELFVDDWLVDRSRGQAELRLHHPTPQNVALVTGEPWEGNATNYVTVFQDGDKYRMYYRGSHASYLGGKDRPTTPRSLLLCRERDGITGPSPSWGCSRGTAQARTTSSGMARVAHAFVPFRDRTRGAGPRPATRLSASAAASMALYAFQVGRRHSLDADAPGASDHLRGPSTRKTWRSGTPSAASTASTIATFAKAATFALEHEPRSSCIGPSRSF